MDSTISIEDSNDTNGNGIPDFSDRPEFVPTPPRLRIELREDTVLLELEGEVGRLHAIEESPALDSSAWTTTASINLTNSVHILELPRPTGHRFWRATVP
jgi:hypothetical protein